MSIDTSYSPENLLYLFERPQEPAWFPKGDGNIRFILPEKYLAKENQKIATENLAGKRFTKEQKINIKEVIIPAKLVAAKQLGKNENFSLFIPYHQQLAGDLIKVFVDAESLPTLTSLLAYGRENLNQALFNYAMSVALLHRKDTNHLTLPPLSENFPDKFLNNGIIDQARHQANVFDYPEVEATDIPAIVVPRDYTATDLEEEHRVAYFREDLGINLHHYHWHLVYPFEGDMNIVNKNRRGELFYYMHQQILARYNFERFCNKLGRVKSLNSLREPINEAYFPKMQSMIASRVWATRPANTLLSDIKRDESHLEFKISDLERWRDRIYDAIHSKTFLMGNGSIKVIPEDTGIDDLGNIIEASILSTNKQFYGNLHNSGHMLIAFCHDPDHRHLETYSVMGESATAMRDPIFYRWHAFINDIFAEYKGTLAPYEPTKNGLSFEGINIEEVKIQTEEKNKNEFHTTFSESRVFLSNGIDYGPKTPIYALITHLNHKNFDYYIKVNNEENEIKEGTVRIYLAPKYDARGTTLFFKDQRQLFIELDKFTATLNPGLNEIKRSSKLSSVTIPFEQTFRDRTNEDKKDQTEAGMKNNYCGCGWPHHMLIPKGTPEGYKCELFVMISDNDLDKVEQESDDKDSCTDASSYCGIRNKLYPDKRAMGFPFDRVQRGGIFTLKDFVKTLPNMKVTDVKIFFNEPQNKNDI